MQLYILGTKPTHTGNVYGISAQVGDKPWINCVAYGSRTAIERAGITWADGAWIAADWRGLPDPQASRLRGGARQERQVVEIHRRPQPLDAEHYAHM